LRTSMRLAGLVECMYAARDNVAKRVALQSAAFSLALILSSLTKAGTPNGSLPQQKAF
jgi:hypothetical protein